MIVYFASTIIYAFMNISSSLWCAVSDSRARGHGFRYPVWPHIFVSPFADSRRAVGSYWQKYVHIPFNNNTTTTNPSHLVKLQLCMGTLILVLLLHVTGVIVIV